MRELFSIVVVIALLASCSGKEIELGAKHEGQFYSFDYPESWRITSRDDQTVIETGSSSFSFRFAALDNSRANDCQSISELVDNYVKTVSKNGSVSGKQTVEIFGKKAVWIESQSASIKTICFFMPMVGGVYIGETKDISDSDMLEAARKSLLSFNPFKTPETKPVPAEIEYVTHNGVIYSISFPKHWVINGDNPMTIKGDGKSMVIGVEQNAESKPSEISTINKNGLPETLIGNVKALEEASPDKAWTIYRIPLAKKVMTIRISTRDAVVEECLKSFKYFPDKDVTTTRQDPGLNTKIAGEIKKTQDVEIPKPEQANIPAGETHATQFYTFMLPRGWTFKNQTAMIESLYPPDAKSGSSVEISVQDNMGMSALDIAKIQIDLVEGAKPEIRTVDVAGTKAAQFTYDAGSGPTVNTIVIKGNRQYTIIYFGGKANLTNEYAAILKTFEPK